MNIPTVSSFVFYLLGMLAIGIYFYLRTRSLSDYVLGGRQLGSTVAALSAGASDMSGWLLLGLPGAMYVGGMNNVWIGVGLVIGAYLNWQFVAKRLRIYTEVANDSITLPDYLENRFNDQSRVLRVASAVVILVFFTFYTSAGMVGGAILFEETFGLNYNVALWLGAIVIVSYTFLGGFMAVSWTDFFQGLLIRSMRSASVCDRESGWMGRCRLQGSLPECRTCRYLFRHDVSGNHLPHGLGSRLLRPTPHSGPVYVREVLQGNSQGATRLHVVDGTIPVRSDIHRLFGHCLFCRCPS